MPVDAYPSIMGNVVLVPPVTPEVPPRVRVLTKDDWTTLARNYPATETKSPAFVERLHRSHFATCPNAGRFRR